MSQCTAVENNTFPPEAGIRELCPGGLWNWRPRKANRFRHWGITDSKIMHTSHRTNTWVTEGSHNRYVFFYNSPIQLCEITSGALAFKCSSINLTKPNPSLNPKLHTHEYTHMLPSLSELPMLGRSAAVATMPMWWLVFVSQHRMTICSSTINTTC